MPVNPKHKHFEWWRASLLLRPTIGEVRSMLEDLERALGGPRAACEVLGLPRLTYNRWRDGTREPTAAAIRAVWLVWALVLHPERIRTVHDLTTWGAFRRVEPQPPREPGRSFATVAQVPDYEI